MSGFYFIKELECFGKNFFFLDWREWFAFGFSCLMLQCSPCSSLTSPQLAGNRSRWLCKKCALILMLAPKFWYASSMFCTTSSKLAALLLPRKFCTTPTKPHHASASSGFIESMNISSCISFRMSSPSKIFALSFSILSPGNDRPVYLQHSSSLSRAFTNCLISPNFICRGASMILPPFSDRRRFSSYAGCILCTQKPVLLVHTSPPASSNDLLELKRIHLCCVTNFGLSMNRRQELAS